MADINIEINGVVDPENPSNGDTLIYNSTTETWEAKKTRFPFGKSGLNIFPHRGVTAFGAPENSLISLYHAHLMDFDYCEFDVQTTLDNEFVVIHDESLNSQFTLANGSPIVGTVNIADITLADAQNLYRRSSTIAGYRVKITTLNDFLADCVKYNITPVLEVKSELDESLDDALIALTRKYFKDQEVMVDSFYPEILARICSKANYYPAFTDATLSEELIDLAAENRGGVFVQHATITAELMAYAVARDVDVLAYTVDNQGDYNRVLQLGVRGVTSNVFSSENYDTLDVVSQYESGLDFTGCTLSGTPVVSGSGVAILASGGYIVSPNVTTAANGSVSAEIKVQGNVNIQFRINGALQETVNFVTNTQETFKVNRLITTGGSVSLMVIANEANCLVKVINIRSSRYQPSTPGYNFRDLRKIDGLPTSYGHTVEGVIQANVDVARLFWTQANAVGNKSFIIHFQATQGTFGSTVGEQIGFAVQSTLVGGVVNKGYVGDIPAAANRWNNYFGGTAQNWWAGKAGFGPGKSVPTYEVDVNGRVDAVSFGVAGTIGKDGTFTTVDGKTITVTKGLITAIV